MDERARVEAQVAFIRGANGAPGAVIIPPEWPDVSPYQPPQYVARDGYVLVRDADVARVSEVLPGRPVGDREGNINGLTLYAYDPSFANERGLSVDGVCDFVDRALGLGVVTPDHLLYFVPTGSFCAATEPESVPSPSRPYPQPPRPTTDGFGVRVWVLDTGLLDDAVGLHPWLAEVTGETDEPYDSNSGEILSYAGHGTFCAGVVRTTAPAALVHSARTFVRVPEATTGPSVFYTKAGVFESDLAEIAAIALRRGAQILSLSFGTYSRKDIPLLGISALKPLIDQYPGVALIAAAGNDSVNEYFWPAAFDWVVSVGALNRNWDDRAWFSNFGPWVQLFAPGEDLVNAYVSHGTFTCIESPNAGQKRDFYGMARWSGTSFSAPLVAGLIACRMSHTGETAGQAAAGLVADAAMRPGLGKVVLPDSCGCPACRGGRGADCGSGCRMGHLDGRCGRC